MLHEFMFVAHSILDVGCGSILHTVVRLEYLELAGRAAASLQHAFYFSGNQTREWCPGQHNLSQVQQQLASSKNEKELRGAAIPPVFIAPTPPMQTASVASQ